MLKSSLKLWCVFFLIFNSSYSFAQLTDSLKEVRINSGSEFYVGQSLGSPLMTVNLVSGVAKPGVYHIPVNTSLSQLFAYAGGTRKDAALDEVMLKRVSHKNKYKLIEVNFEEQMNSANSPLLLTDRDIIHVPQNANIDATMKWVGLISATVTIVLSVVLIKNNSN